MKTSAGVWVWQPANTAPVNELASHKRWVLVHTTDGRVTEARPHFDEYGCFIWITLRGTNCRGSEVGFFEPLIDAVTHWMPLPAAPIP